MRRHEMLRSLGPIEGSHDKRPYDRFHRTKSLFTSIMLSPADGSVSIAKQIAWCLPCGVPIPSTHRAEYAAKK